MIRHIINHTVNAEVFISLEINTHVTVNSTVILGAVVNFVHDKWTSALLEQVKDGQL